MRRKGTASVRRRAHSGWPRRRRLRTAAVVPARVPLIKACIGIRFPFVLCVVSPFDPDVNAALWRLKASIFATVRHLIDTQLHVNSRRNVVDYLLRNNARVSHLQSRRVTLNSR